MMSDGVSDFGLVNLDEMGRGVERRCLLAALEAANYNQSYTARLLNLSEGRVRALMRRYQIRPRNHRGRPRSQEDLTFDEAAARLVGHVPVCIDEDIRLFKHIRDQLVFWKGGGTFDVGALIEMIDVRLGGNREEE
jgi:hypothetical protein